MNKKTILMLAGVGSLVAVPAMAQPGRWTPRAAPSVAAPAEQSPGLNKGQVMFSIAGGLGLGERGPAASARLGYTLSPRFALTLNASVWGEAEADIGNADQDDIEAEADFLFVYGVGLQVWLTHRIWANASIGGARVELSRPPPDEGGINYSGVGVSGAVGFNVLANSKGAIDLRFEAMAGEFEVGSSGRAMGMIGITFF